MAFVGGSATGGEVADCSSAPELIAKLHGTEAIVADKGYDSERLREQIESQDSQGRQLRDGAGHGSGKPTDKAIEEIADMWGVCCALDRTERWHFRVISATQGCSGQTCWHGDSESWLIM